MPKGMVRQMTKEEEDWIKDNLQYDPDTGHLWWIADNDSNRKRNLDSPAGAKSNGYLIVTLAGKHTTIRLHRVAWFLYYGIWPKGDIDHINNIRDDNRLVNLREATRQENGRNQKVREGGSSKYKGVYWNKKTCKWMAQTKINGKQTNLGYYDNEEEAALVYNKAALEHFGEYAKINVIEPLDTSVTNTYISSSSGELTC